ncbi:MAG: MerR family transcriptional regulator [Thermoleophilia bacterium]
MSARRIGVYLIGVAAELAGMHPQTLRLYERRGLITPQRSEGRTRRYTDADVALLRRIHELSELGLNLAGIERVLELEARLERAQTRVAQLEKELVRRERAHTEAMDEYKRSTRAELVRVTCTETALVPVVRPIIRGRR